MSRLVPSSANPAPVDAALVAQIDELLPQTQCRMCGYPGCRPYAEALAAGAADTNQCPPGGDEGARELAALLGVEGKPVDRRFGVPGPAVVAMIDEALCIGCTLCIEACPVDAIAGAPKMMHTVIARDCTGCKLCLPPCPVDCISLQDTVTQATRAERRDAAERARRRYARRNARLERQTAGAHALKRLPESADARVKHQTVQRAIERARHRLAQRKQSGR